LYNEGVPIALVLENDAYPKVCNLKEQIQKAIDDAPPDWEIIQLHNDSPTVKIDAFKNGSGAAYLINRQGQKKMKDLILYNHIDIQWRFLRIIIHPYNLFWTDESTSSNATRKKTPFDLIKLPRGEKTLGDIFSFKNIRLGKVELNTYGINSIILLIILIIFYVTLK
jgi:hypothetical protein